MWGPCQSRPAQLLKAAKAANTHSVAFFVPVVLVTFLSGMLLCSASLVWKPANNPALLCESKLDVSTAEHGDGKVQIGPRNLLCSNNIALSVEMNAQLHLVLLGLLQSCQGLSKPACKAAQPRFNERVGKFCFKLHAQNSPVWRELTYIDLTKQAFELLFIVSVTWRGFMQAVQRRQSC